AHLVQRAGRDLLAQHLDRVMLVDTQVAQAGGRGGVEQPADAGAMHLDADEIARRLVLAGVQQLLAVAEADLDHARGLAAEHGVEITWLAAVVQAVGGPVQFEGALLGFGLPALAQDEAADRAVPGEVLAGVLVAGVAHVRGRAHRKCPSTGEEALACRFLGMRPARKASRPAATALRMALAISTGSFAPAMAVFISTPSQPSSMAMAASEAVPTPASTSTGTLAFSTISRMDQRFWIPRPEPIGAASGITATQPISSRRRARIGSSLV